MTYHRTLVEAEPDGTGDARWDALLAGIAEWLAARDAAMDLDTAIRQHHGPVLAEARVVAPELGLPSWWLNEQATPYLPAGEDVEARTVLDRPGLTVIAAYAATCWP